MSIQALRDRLARLDKMECVEPEWSVGTNRGELEAALAEYDRLRSALRELDWHNPLHSDLDDYCHDLAQWGLGKVEGRPKPEEYGLDLLIPDEFRVESEGK